MVLMSGWHSLGYQWHKADDSVTEPGHQIVWTWIYKLWPKINSHNTVNCQDDGRRWDWNKCPSCSPCTAAPSPQKKLEKAPSPIFSEGRGGSVHRVVSVLYRVKQKDWRTTVPTLRANHLCNDLFRITWEMQLGYLRVLTVNIQVF